MESCCAVLVPQHMTPYKPTVAFAVDTALYLVASLFRAFSNQSVTSRTEDSTMPLSVSNLSTQKKI